jgi:micrococcal nuclease
MGRKIIIFLALLALPLRAWAGDVMIQSCHDGDTCTVQVAGLSIKVRLVGIDAPEIGKKKGSEQPFAKESRDALNEMVAGKSLQIAQYGIDAFNRPLVTIRMESGALANEELVRQGLAEVYDGSEHYDRATLRSLQAQAKSAGRGIWSLGGRYVSPTVYRKKMKD